MFTQYVEKAMRKAEYERIEDGTYFGQIPGFQGVWGDAGSLEACREDLRGALEGWLILGLWLNDPDIPKLGRLDLVPPGSRLSRKNEPTLPSRTRKGVLDAWVGRDLTVAPITSSCCVTDSV